MIKTNAWQHQFLDEINHAQYARNQGNEGKARVCARRAAGIVIGEYFQRSGIPDVDRSAYVRLRQLSQIYQLSNEVREVSAHFLQRVDIDHKLPVEADLIAEAYWLAQTLLGYTQSVP